MEGRLTSFSAFGISWSRRLKWMRLVLKTLSLLTTPIPTGQRRGHEGVTWVLMCVAWSSWYIKWPLSYLWKWPQLPRKTCQTLSVNATEERVTLPSGPFRYPSKCPQLIQKPNHAHNSYERLVNHVFLGLHATGGHLLPLEMNTTPMKSVSNVCQNAACWVVPLVARRWRGI